MNNKIFGSITKTTQYSENGKKYEIKVNIVLRSLSGQTPYLSITGDINRVATDWRRVNDTSGCIHGEIINHFPEFEPLIKWHLVSVESPMHYISNSLYWAGLSGWTDGKKDSPPNFEYLKNTCLWGINSLEFDFILRLLMGLGAKTEKINIFKSKVLTFILEKRLESVQKSFYNMIKDVFGDDILESALQFENERNQK